MTDPNPLTFADFAAIVSYVPNLSFSPDGTHIAYSCDRSGQFNVWVHSIETGEARQLTHYTDNSVRELTWSPDGKQILFTADTQGDEQHQLHLISLDGGEPVHLTNQPEVQYYLAGLGSWSPDGQYIAFAGNDREPTAQDVIVREVHTAEDDRPLMDGKIYFPVAWSPDGNFLSVIDFRSNTDFVPMVLDVRSGHTIPFPGADEAAQYIPGPWKADSSGYWMLTDKGREFQGLIFVDAVTGTYDWILQPEWDVESVAASADGRYLAWSTNVEGYSRISVRSLETGQDLEMTGLPHGVLRGELTFSPDGDSLAFRVGSPVSPFEIWRVDLDTGKSRQLTHSRLRALDGVTMVEPELVRFPAFDGRQIPAWLFRPHGDGPFPVVLSIHGGPESQERPDYADRGLFQYLLSKGIAVLAPNIRGSTGYGKTYQKLIHRDLGGNDLHDFESCVKYLHSLDWIDRDRIGVYGGSYGGFAVLSCVSRLPDYWAAAVDIVGPSNLVTLLRTCPPTWRESVKLVFGDPDTEEEDLLRRSPISYVDQIKTPLFVIQGANDPRVVQAESDQIVEKLRARGVDVRYDVYEDEGHGFTKKENELKALGDSAEFLIEHLLE